MTHNSLMRSLLEMAIPASLADKTFYHGCSLRSSAMSILQDGIKPNLSRTKGFLKPIDGKVYLTHSIAYAQIYAIGGDVAGHTNYGLKLADPDEQFGYVFVIDGAALQDVIPDEDLVGELCTRYLQFERGRAQEARFPTLKNYYAKYDTTENRALSALAVRYGTSNVIRKATEGEMAWVAKLGKQILSRASETEISMLMDVPEVHAIAAHGTVVPSQCWELFKPRDIPLLMRDGSNFFTIAKQIS